jgi:hypothetical protein
LLLHHDQGFLPSVLDLRNEADIDNSLALVEMRIVLARLLWSFDLELGEGVVEWNKCKIYITADKATLWVRLKLIERVSSKAAATVVGKKVTDQEGAHDSLPVYIALRASLSSQQHEQDPLILCFSLSVILRGIRRALISRLHYDHRIGIQKLFILLKLENSNIYIKEISYCKYSVLLSF